MKIYLLLNILFLPIDIIFGIGFLMGAASFSSFDSFGILISYLLMILIFLLPNIISFWVKRSVLEGNKNKIYLLVFTTIKFVILLVLENL